MYPASAQKRPCEQEMAPQSVNSPLSKVAPWTLLCSLAMFKPQSTTEISDFYVAAGHNCSNSKEKAAHMLVNKAS